MDANSKQLDKLTVKVDANSKQLDLVLKRTGFSTEYLVAKKLSHLKGDNYASAYTIYNLCALGQLIARRNSNTVSDHYNTMISITSNCTNGITIEVLQSIVDFSDKMKLTAYDLKETKKLLAIKDDSITSSDKYKQDLHRHLITHPIGLLILSLQAIAFLKLVKQQKTFAVPIQTILPTLLDLLSQKTIDYKYLFCGSIQLDHRGAITTNGDLLTIEIGETKSALDVQQSKKSCQQLSRNLLLMYIGCLMGMNKSFATVELVGKVSTFDSQENDLKENKSIKQFFDKSIANYPEQVSSKFKLEAFQFA